MSAADELMDWVYPLETVGDDAEWADDDTAVTPDPMERFRPHLDAVAVELAKQVAEHGARPDSLLTQADEVLIYRAAKLERIARLVQGIECLQTNWPAIYGEEFGESIRAYVAHVESPTPQTLADLRAELMQVAAVCLAIAEHATAKALDLEYEQSIVAANEWPCCGCGEIFDGGDPMVRRNVGTGMNSFCETCGAAAEVPKR